MTRSLNHLREHSPFHYKGAFECPLLLLPLTRAKRSKEREACEEYWMHLSLENSTGWTFGTHLPRKQDRPTKPVVQRDSHSKGASERTDSYLPQDLFTWSISAVSRPSRQLSNHQQTTIFQSKRIFYPWKLGEKQKPGTFSNIMYTPNANPGKSLPCSEEVGGESKRRICSGRLFVSLFILCLKRRQNCFLGHIKILVSGQKFSEGTVTGSFQEP